MRRPILSLEDVEIFRILFSIYGVAADYRFREPLLTRLQKTYCFIAAVLFFYGAEGGVAWTQVDLQYQDRGNRHEGIKPKPVSGYDIELISVRADYDEEAERMPDRLKVKFYLEQPAEVGLTVRELDYKYYYWMDKIQPSRPWRPGFDNVFEWPTKDVIQRLGHLATADLGIIVRLDRRNRAKWSESRP